MVEISSTSTSAVLSTLVTNLIAAGIFVGCFLILRLKFKRIYSPKANFDLVPEEKKPEPLPSDPFSWIYILLTKPHSFIIQQAGLDGYFFLRYLLIMALTFLFGMLTWIILLPINATNGKGNVGLDQLSIANVKHQHRYYAHVIVGWVYYGIVIFVIYRELFFYNSLRCAVLSSPKYAKRLSSRTVLFQSVPYSLLDEKQFIKMFEGVKRIYIVKSSRKLESAVRRRDAEINRLELAQNKLLRTAVKNKMKADKKGLLIEPADEISAYVPEKKRPSHRLGGMFSKKTDTIRHAQEEIPKLNDEVRKLQKHFRTFKLKNSIFVEFENQYYAQVAFQTTIHHNPMRLSPAYTGLSPGDIQWGNMRLFWWELITRSTIAYAVIIALIILWAVPVAFVGLISNITYLTNKVHWLRFILNMPEKLLGIITGLLPTILLSFLMSLLPIFIRAMAQVAGMPSVQHIELFTQNAYFAFLIINSFLVTAVSSSATATVTKILENPQLAMSILAAGLPKSSNFFISYIVLQGLGISGSSLFQVVGLFLYYILGALLDRTVRKKWIRFSTLGTMAWGGTFPIYSNLASITLAFCIISPMILLFATAAFLMVYVTYCYNLTYVFIECADTRGLHYPVALMQTFTGIYLGQICMLGILAVGKGWGPIVLQAIGLVTTIFCHIYLRSAFNGLRQVVPVDCMRALDGVSSTPSFDGETEYQTKVLDRKNTSRVTEKERAKEDREEEEIKDDLAEEREESKHLVVPLLADRDFKEFESHNFLIRFFRPDVFYNYKNVRKMLPSFYYDNPDEEDNKHAYHVPATSAKPPNVWIPKDPYGLSTIQIEELSRIVRISDENSTFDKKGNIVYLGGPPS